MGPDPAETTGVKPFLRLSAAAAATTLALTAAITAGSAALADRGAPGTQLRTVALESGAAPARSRLEPVDPRPVTPAASPAAKSVARPVRKAPLPARTKAAAPKATSVVRTVRATAASTASSHLRGCDGTSGWQSRRGAYAMRRITYNWRKTGYTIHFLAARRGITGMTYPSSQRIEVYVRSCSKMTNAYLAETIAHEIGHAVDFTLGTDAWQRQWMVARHISLSIPWYGAPYASDFATPAGDFAETFGAWQVPDGPNDSKWGRPSAAQLKLLIPLLNR